MYLNMKMKLNKTMTLDNLKKIFEYYTLFRYLNDRMYFKSKYKTLCPNMLQFSFHGDSVDVFDKTQDWLMTLSLVRQAGLLTCSKKDIQLGMYHGLFENNIEVVSGDDVASIKRKWTIERILL